MTGEPTSTVDEIGTFCKYVSPGVGDTSNKISIPIPECLIFWYQVLFTKNRKFLYLVIM